MKNNKLNGVLFLQKCIIINNEGKILALKREPSDHGRGGAWDLPGGTYERGEDVIDSIKREVKEEVDLTVLNLYPLYLANGLDNASQFVDSEIVFAVTHVCAEWVGEVKISYEHTEYRWVTPEEFMAYDFGNDGGFFKKSIEAYIENISGNRHS